MGLGVGSQVERGFSWDRKGPLKARVMALRLKAHTAEAAMLFLHGATEDGSVSSCNLNNTSGDVVSGGTPGSRWGTNAVLGRFLRKCNWLQLQVSVTLPKCRAKCKSAATISIATSSSLGTLHRCDATWGSRLRYKAILLPVPSSAWRAAVICTCNKQ